MLTTVPNHVTCTRCNGLSVRETMVDYSEGNGLEGKWDAYRCMNCGWETDSVMEANRAAMRTGVWPRAQELKGIPYKPEVEA